ncbi:energy transducer TonB [Aequorivita sp. CIP111184]|uniref:energy transducer TonB n=1 Tax=Aequorivita sp. CIP111184 TaxID=2211356 RepID=UPI000DBC0DA3|nr:energy transducer TonB [Aequorivita sp. CIP111184]SRX53020.1 hypothetical protein AEQU1_00816 [Aequorivita sp. CIP111184]
MKTTKENARNKRQEKKQTNIKWNSRLFFQIGVITSLFIVFFIMQTNFEIKTYKVTSSTSEGIIDPPMIDYVLDVDIPKPAEPIKKIIEKQTPIQKPIKSTVFDVKPDTAPDIETPIADTNAPVIDAPITPDTPPIDAKPSGPTSIMNVEFVPVFPGCDVLGTNAEKIECMSSKINSFINKNFRKELLEDLKSNETYKIYVNFKIDSNGFVTDVIANSNNTNLKKEAQRVIRNLPTMEPGKQGDKNVDVLHTVPIIFKIQ